MTKNSKHTKRAAGRAGAAVMALGLLAMLSPLLVVGAAADEHEVPDPPPGVSVDVNGVPMSGEEGGKIEGCSVAIAVSGLPESPDPSTDIDVRITAVPPAVPEGSPLDLVSESFTTDVASWTQDFPLDDLVAPLNRAGNGYHLRVRVTINGTLAGSNIYWLGCGESQSGNPHRILLAMQWRTNDGVTHDDAPIAVLPAGWEASLQLDGTSQTGTATCAYTTGSAVLECTYDNPGHGDQPGLVVPGNPKATYDVAVNGVPSAWTVQATTVGTFVGRETCPRGGDHEDGGDHQSGGAADVAAPTAHEGEDGHDRDGCVHTVVLVQDPALPPPPVPPVEPPAVTPVAPATADVQAATATAGAAGQLPATGVESTTLIRLALVLLATGGALTGWAAYRRRAGAAVCG
jgi:hypothetical protein